MHPLYEYAAKSDLPRQVVQSSIAPIGIGTLRESTPLRGHSDFLPILRLKDRVLVRRGGAADDPLKRFATFR